LDLLRCRPPLILSMAGTALAGGRGGSFGRCRLAVARSGALGFVRPQVGAAVCCCVFWRLACADLLFRAALGLTFGKEAEE
jgi:hypothetical protein